MGRICHLGAFGYFSFASVLWVLHDGPPTYTAEGLRSIVVYEVAAFFLLGSFLRLRGWTLRGHGAAMPTLNDVLLGIGLGVGVSAVAGAIRLAVATAAPQTMDASFGDPLRASAISA